MEKEIEEILWKDECWDIASNFNAKEAARLLKLFFLRKQLELLETLFDRSDIYWAIQELEKEIKNLE